MKKRKKQERVGDRMSSPSITVTSEDSLQSAIDLLAKHNIRELPVVENGSLIGIVTDRDLRQVSPSYPLFRDQQEIQYHLRNIKVASAMTTDPLVVSPKTPLVEAAKLLHAYRIGSLPVVEKGKVVGIISVTDLLKVFIE
jgi:acetoin utilization protein AcuB